MSDVVIVMGSNNKNLELAKEFEAELGRLGVSHKLIDLVELDLPMYTPARQANGIPDEISGLISTFDNAKGFLFVTPEYNGGLPPVISSLIAWVSVAGGNDWRKSFNGKPAAMATFSGGNGIHAMIALRMQLSYIGVNVLGREVRATYQNALNKEDLEAVSKILSESI